MVDFLSSSSLYDAMDDRKWADTEADEDYEPDFKSTGQKGFETKVDKDGWKIVTNYTKNARGETVKTTKRVKVIRKVYRVNKAVYARRNIQPFGCEDPDAPRGSSATTTAPEDVFFIEVPKNRNRFKMKDDDDDDFYFGDLAPCKTSKDLKQKFKALKEELDECVEGQKRLSDDGKSGKYVNPRQRDGEKYREMEQRQKEECTIRVTNLSEEVEDRDLEDLFGTIGRILRIYLAKHKESKNSKGFAFITYQKREDAARAIRQLNRHGYDNLLLNVEWAKPSNRDRP